MSIDINEITPIELDSGLYLVSTPIGNLGDITLRALETLASVDLILAEDTRTTGKLLKRYGIATKQRSYHIHNEHQIVNDIVSDLENGQRMALVSDAGSPAVSDPGFLLVRECVKNNIEVFSIPGPTALISALQISGLPTDRFVFEGFLPVKKGRNTRLQEIKEEPRTMVFYESPHKILKTLEDFSTVLGPDRNAFIARELTKLYEEKLHGTLSELINHFETTKPKGEFVICIEGKK